VAVSDVKYGGLKYTESIDFLKKKSSLKTRHWDSLNTGAHIKAFTIAGALKTDLLNDIRSATQSAIDNGTTITEFRKAFDKTIKKHGWNYKGKRGWRTRVIYGTNLRTAHAAGKWHKIQETKKERPYLQYITVGDERTRDEHTAWNGTVLKADDPFWNTHYPPNGWGCRCTVRTLNKSQAKKMGISAAPEIKKEQRIDRKTGEVYQGIDGIDTGWDYNVGREDIYNNMTDVYRKIDPIIGNMLLKKLVTNKAVLTGWLANSTKQFLPISKLPNDIKTALKSDNDLLLLSNDTMIKQIKKHSDLGVDDFAQISDVLLTGKVLKNRQNAVEILTDDYLLAVKITSKNENFISSFHKINMKKKDKKIKKAINKNMLIR
jgi:SPP1 gp7 family putative phage head morphogenesis protein